MPSQKYFTPIMIALLTAMSGFAQTNYKIITTAVPFLRIPADARAAAMGSTGIASSHGTGALLYNIGQLPFAANNAAVSLNYSPWFRQWSNDMFMATAAGYYKTGNGNAVHAQVRYFNPGELQFKDNNGNYLQTYNPHEFAADLGYSMKLSGKSGLGIRMRYIHSALGEGTQDGDSFKPGNAVASDIGFYYDARNQNAEGWSFGAQLSNLGSKISYNENENHKDLLPANLGLGTAYTKVIDEDNKVIVAIDLNKLLVPMAPSDSAALINYRNKSIPGSWGASFTDASFGEELKEVQISTGLEYSYRNQFALRAGYHYENKLQGDRRYFSAGAGLTYKLITVNFAYMAAAKSNPLNNTLLFGLTLKFDQ